MVKSKGDYFLARAVTNRSDTLVAMPRKLRCNVELSKCRVCQEPRLFSETGNRVKIGHRSDHPCQHALEVGVQRARAEPRKAAAPARVVKEQIRGRGAVKLSARKRGRQGRQGLVRPPASWVSEFTLGVSPRSRVTFVPECTDYSRWSCVFREEQGLPIPVAEERLRGVQVFVCGNEGKDVGPPGRRDEFADPVRYSWMGHTTSVLANGCCPNDTDHTRRASGAPLSRTSPAVVCVAWRLRHTAAGSTTATPVPNPVIRVKCATLKVNRCVTPCTRQTATRRASWTCLPMTPTAPTRAFHAG